MSTNPFRRSTLKGPSGNSGVSENTSIASAPIDIPDAGANTPTSLSVNTKVPFSIQKHVNFASPPAVPIPPVSYPPSPQSTRLSPASAGTSSVLPPPTDYSAAIQSDPFQAEAETDEDDVVIEQAIANARVNTTLVAPGLDASRNDAVKNTLSRFANTPRKPANASRNGDESQTSLSQRQTMDVDAFKRLLLTGDAGQGRPGEDSSLSTAASGSSQPSGHSRSSTETAPSSKRSLFAQASSIQGSPRSSIEFGVVEEEPTRRSSQIAEERKKPSAPIPRHGRPLKEDAVTEWTSESISAQSPPASVATKTPPTPPLARRHSQNSDLRRSNSSRRSSSSEADQSRGTTDTTSRAAPPPPRSRRPVSTLQRKSTSDLPTTAEEPDSDDSSNPPSSNLVDTRPIPPPARNSSKRMSMEATNHPPPPPPPPRRGRGSGRSDYDNTRSLVSVVPESDESVLTGEDLSQQGSENRTISSSSNVDDMLADLAALQRDVDEARRKAGR